MHNKLVYHMAPLISVKNEWVFGDQEKDLKIVNRLKFYRIPYFHALNKILMCISQLFGFILYVICS